MKSKVDIMESNNHGWLYSDKVKDHFFHPRNFVIKGKPKGKFNGVGLVGNPACGDMMRVWIWVDSSSERIKKCRWQTFGCASAIAATSVMSEMVTEKKGMKIQDAMNLSAEAILKRLGGLPKRKIHCSVLGDKALRAAINDYYRRTHQYHKISQEEARVIDKVLKISDRDIEQAVKDGARNLAEVQAKTKIGLGDPKCLPEAEQLTQFYVEKYQ